MDVEDDPKKPEFASLESYREFAHRVRHDRRYVWDSKQQAFLDTVLATSQDRNVMIKAKTIFYRAQLGTDYRSVSDQYDDYGNEIVEEACGFGAERMKPLANRAKEGRINPAGIPMLYLASSEQTAISEVRPWLGSVISVAQVSVLRELRAVNLSRGHGKLSVGHLTLDELEGAKPVDARKKEKAVWIDIDNAFSQPVERSDDAADYVPTQILAELFRDAGFDAVIYRSQFGEKGYNIALFNVEDADVINCAPYRIEGIDLKYKEIGSRSYFKASGGHTGT